MLEKITPNLSETEKIAYVVKLLDPIKLLTNSELEIKEND